MNTYHYTYLITNLKPLSKERYYIGVHSSRIKPNNDTSYMSSSFYLKTAMQTEGMKNFEKIIIEEWNSRRLADAHEAWLHGWYDVRSNHLFYNRCNALNNGFHINNTAHTAKTKLKISKGAARAWARKSDLVKTDIIRRANITRNTYWNNLSPKLIVAHASKSIAAWDSKSLDERARINKSKASDIVHNIGKKNYNNGIINKYFIEGEEDNGFIKGRLMPGN